jgi:hypothetical protein
MRLIGILVAALAISPSFAGGLEISHAYYRDTNASLHLFLANHGNEPVSILAPVVDGQDCASLGRDGLHIANVLWYRCRPNPIPAGGIADLTITLAEPTDKPVTVELTTSSGQELRQVIRCVPEQIRFQAVRFSADLHTVDVYVRSSEDLRRIRMDGIDGGRSGESFGGLAFTRIKLKAPLAPNSFHVFEVEAEGGASTACQVRAIPAEFLIGVYGIASPENIADWAKHGVNHFLSFGAVPADLLPTFAEQNISVGAKYIREHLVDRTAGKVSIYDEETARTSLSAVIDKPSLLYHHLVDEPDVSDYFVNRTLGASGMELAARAEFYERNDPGRYTFVQLDNTFRPRNYRVYGESADMVATHRYSLGSYLRSEAGEVNVKRLPFLEDMIETLDLLRHAAEPKPFFMVTHFFNLGPGRAGRPPTIEEMRLQCYTMIAGGARGLIHYIHSGSTGGGEGGRTPALWDGMTGLHEELARVGEVVKSGSPMPPDWVKCSSPNVLASGLLCGDEMAVVLINLSHRSSLRRFTAIPVRDFTVSLRIPPWIDASELEVRLADTGDTVATTVRGDVLSFTTDQVSDARCVLLRRK